MEALTHNQKGNVAEVMIMAEAMKAGIEVLRPQGEHMRYDLAFDFGSWICRVQCKWGRLTDRGVIVCLASARNSPVGGYIKTAYSASEVDAVAAYCGDLDRCFLLSMGEFDGWHEVLLRLEPPRNNQRAAINFAAEYEFHGAVAQLEERRHGMAEVTGSSPVSSTSPDLEIVGAEAFATHPARFLHRARQGEEFLVTRRGRPMARVIPPG